MTPDINPLLDCAVAAARKAGDHALANRDRRREANSVSPHDIKLKLDVECQAIAEGVIRNTFPDHAILGEEDPRTGTAAETPKFDPDTVRWVIDPIDGTVNFAHGLPRWCCSIGVLQGERPVAGAIYAPVLGKLYTATHESDAMCNGEPIHVSDTATLKQSIVMTGVDRHRDGSVPPLAVFTALADTVQRPRIMGVAALDMCYVAEGGGDGYIETGIFLWDIAAATLIVEQAGGKTEILKHEPGHRLQCLASNGHIHAELKDVVLRALGHA